MFPGESGFTLLECVAGEYKNQGPETGCHYEVIRGQRFYVDVRDMRGVRPRSAVKKCES